MTYRKLTAGLVVVTVIIVFVCGVLGYYVVRAAVTIEFDEGKMYTVKRVIDGDTLEVKVGLRTVTVRMLGVDTPETVDPRKDPQCYGSEASAYTKSLLSDHKVTIRLNAHREATDKYGRYLAYIYLEDGLLVNEALLRNGYAREYTYGKAYSMQKEFRKLEAEAKELGNGLWGRCNYPRI